MSAVRAAWSGKAGRAAAARSLAGVHRCDVFRLERILGDGLRELCDRLDLHEGDVVECRTDAGPWLMLETAHGRTVALERDWARFIQVAAAGSSKS